MTDKDIGKWWARMTVPHGSAGNQGRFISLAHFCESTKYAGDQKIMRCGRTMYQGTARGELTEAPHEAKCWDCQSKRSDKGRL